MRGSASLVIPSDLGHARIREAVEWMVRWKSSSILELWKHNHHRRHSLESHLRVHLRNEEILLVLHLLESALLQICPPLLEHMASSLSKPDFSLQAEMIRRGLKVLLTTYRTLASTQKCA